MDAFYGHGLHRYTMHCHIALTLLYYLPCMHFYYSRLNEVALCVEYEPRNNLI